LFKRLIVAGCSQTYGHGLADISFPDSSGTIDYSKGPSKLAWPALLGKQLGISEVVNLAMPASSNKRIAHVITSVNNLTANDIIIFCWTYPLRSAIIKDNGYDYLHAHKSKHSKTYKLAQQWIKLRAMVDPKSYDLWHENLVWASFANRYLETKVSAVYNYSMMRGFPKDLLELYNVPVIEDLNYIIRKHERALDNSHPGLDAHCEFADRMYNYIRSKND
jgi:hypothetical protein